MLEQKRNNSVCSVVYKLLFVAAIYIVVHCSTLVSKFALLVPVSLRFNMEGEEQQPVERRAIAVGPWGGYGGADWDDGSYNGVREITLMYGRCIDSIRIVYDKNGKPVSAEKHGGEGGSKTAEIKLQFPEEFLTTVTGHYSPVVRGASPVIRSLTFTSNRRVFGPFGVEEGTPFYFPMEGGQIVGFKGRGGWYLDAIGFHISRPQTPKVVQKVKQRLKRLISSVVPRDGDARRKNP